MLRSRSLFRCAVVAVALGLSSAASALTIDFAGLNHGDIFDPSGYQLSVDQNNSSVDLPVVFDSGTPPGSTSDQDLLFGGGWASGSNIAGRDLGNLLILQESAATCGATSCGDPDDSERGGSFVFTFEQLFSSLSFALVDIDDSEAAGGSVRLIRRESGQADVVVADRSFDTFAGIGFGNRSANEFQLAGLEGAFNVVEFRFAGSGAIGELDLTEVPEPTTAALTALGLLGLGALRRRYRAAR